VAEPPGERSALVLAHIADDDPRALAEERARVRLPHAPGTPGDDGDPAVELAHGIVIPYDHARCNPRGHRRAAGAGGGSPPRGGWPPAPSDDLVALCGTNSSFDATRDPARFPRRPGRAVRASPAESGKGSSCPACPAPYDGPTMSTAPTDAATATPP